MNDWIRVKSKCRYVILLVLLLKPLCSTYEISTQLRLLICIPVLRPSRYFITARASATWWPQPWTCQQCWASVPGGATVITTSKSTWLWLRWAPSFLPAGLRRDTSLCSGLSFKDAECTHATLGRTFPNFFTGCDSSLCQTKCWYCFTDPFKKTWNHWLWECKRL